MRTLQGTSARSAGDAEARSQIAGACQAVIDSEREASRGEQVAAIVAIFVLIFGLAWIFNLILEHAF
jgi:hypothetical protein